MRQRARSAWHRPWAILLVCLSFAMSGIAARSAMAQEVSVPPDESPQEPQQGDPREAASKWQRTPTGLEGMKLDEATDVLNAWGRQQPDPWRIEIKHEPDVPGGADREFILVHGVQDTRVEFPDGWPGATRDAAFLSVTLVPGTKVPNLKGQTRQEARSTLRQHGLNLPAESTRGGDDRIVAKQSPPPGTSVPLNAVVTLGFKPLSPPSPRPDDVEPPAKMLAILATLVAIGCIVTLLWLLLAALSAARANRARREREWVRQHVRLRSYVTPREPRLESRGKQRHSVTVVLQKDRGSQVFQEIAPP